MTWVHTLVSRHVIGQYKQSLLDINECMTTYHDCHANAKCTDFIPSVDGKKFECECKGGYTGDGTVDCRGMVTLQYINNLLSNAK